jgi:hypothetical protein
MAGVAFLVVDDPIIKTGGGLLIAAEVLGIVEEL